MVADELEETKSERNNHTYRVIGSGAVLCVIFSTVLLVFSRLERQVDWVKYESKEAQLDTAKAEATNVIGWGRNASRDTTKFIDPINDTTIIPGKEICGNQPTTLVIVVPSSPSEVSRRELIRETWGSQKVSRVKIGFLVGLTKNRTIQISLERESQRYQDIIQENIVDTFNNLTLKSIALLKWYNRNCRNSSFLMKTDVDTFVNVEWLVGYLTNYQPKGVLMGHIWHDCSVPRAANDKYAVPKYEFENETYPDFLSGSAYIMSSDVVERLFAAALKTPIFHLEDVYITGFCGQEAGVTPQHFPGSSIDMSLMKGTLLCWPNHTVCHPVGPEDMRRLWEKRGDSEFQRIQFPLLEYRRRNQRNWQQ